jgi:cytoskeletal protein CcmA (bactofilin family)
MLGKNQSEDTFVSPARGPVSTETKTLIGEHISIDGDIRGEGDLVIEGLVKGSIHLEKYHLTVGPKGRLTGNIMAFDKVTITKDADFNGEIKAKRISVEDGAYLKASIELERESQIKTVPIGKPANEKASELQKEPTAQTSKADKGK